MAPGASNSTSPDVMLGIASSDLPMFHDGSPQHQSSLQSKECQKADWSSHKAQCKSLKEERDHYAKLTGIPTALEDVWGWAEYYEAPLKNCAIAAARLKEKTYAESKKEFLCIGIEHTGRADVPVHRRFEVKSVGREEVSDTRFSSFADLSDILPRLENMGRIEMGRNFYGIISYIVIVTFTYPDGRPKALYPWPKQFSIDKSTARANALQVDWWNLFRQYVSMGKKIKFCCGKLAGDGFSDICCCGGWTHDEEKKVCE
ncbi:hypothetical protein AAF712_013297 [Marasmius tenuissimus]|uniref:MYND-type domain-containing protein n=1 Tax=Marasmius tenuissimus TaxID=585030 RepID=A0ABR2ZF25_9AGAR